MKNISIILLFVIAIACSSKMKQKSQEIELESEQAVSVIDDSDAFEREMLALGDDMILTDEDKTIFKQPKTITQNIKRTKAAALASSKKTPLITKITQAALVIPSAQPSSSFYSKPKLVLRKSKSTAVKNKLSKKTLIGKVTNPPEKAGFLVYNKATKSMININQCSHIVYSKQYARPTCLKSL